MTINDDLKLMIGKVSAISQTVDKNTAVVTKMAQDNARLQAQLDAANAEIARLRAALETIERNAPQAEPLDVYSPANHPQAHSFWAVGIIARAALKPTE